MAITFTGNKPIVADESLVLADFTQKSTVDQWMAASVIASNLKGKYDTVYNAYSMNWVLGSVGENYLNSLPEKFANLDFSDYGSIHLDFYINRSEALKLKYPQVKNWFTVVLSTSENPGLYDKYKNNECLTYEIDLSEFALNKTVSADIPLADFVTQFDGMKDGVQGTKDGTTNRSDIRSVSIYSGAANGGRLNANNESFHTFTTWAFKNTAQAPSAGSMYLQEIMLAPMKLKSTSIENGAKDILPDSKEISFTFNDNIATPPINCVTVLKNGEEQQNYQLKANGNVLTVSFLNYLDLKSEYHILISNELTGKCGGKLSENILFGFSTAVMDNWTGDFGVYTSNGKFTDMESSANVYAKAGYVNSSAEKNVILTIAGYRQGKLVDVKSVPVKITDLYNSVISTEEISYNPQTMDSIKAFLWDAESFMPVAFAVLP